MEYTHHSEKAEARFNMGLGMQDTTAAAAAAILDAEQPQHCQRGGLHAARVPVERDRQI